MVMLSWCGTRVSVIPFATDGTQPRSSVSLPTLWPQCKSVQVDGRCTQECKSDPHAEHLLAVLHPLHSVPESASHSILNKTLFCLFLCVRLSGCQISKLIKRSTDRSCIFFSFLSELLAEFPVFQVRVCENKSENTD